MGVTGDDNVDHSFMSKHVTIGPAPCISAGTHETQLTDLTQCQFHADLNIIFQLHIEHYSLHVVELYAQGDMNGDLTTNGQMLNKEWSGTRQFKIFDSTLFSISIPVAGIPLPLKLHAEMYSHVHWDIDGEVTINSDIHATGELKLGVQYTPQHGFQPVRVNTLQGTGDLNSATGVFTVDGSIELDTVFGISALYVATASTHVEITPHFHGVATETIIGPGGEEVFVNGTHVEHHHIAPVAPQTFGMCAPTANANSHVDDPSFQMTADLDVNVNAGANVDVKLWHHTLYDHTFNFGTIYSHDWTFGPWCRHLHL